MTDYLKSTLKETAYDWCIEEYGLSEENAKKVSVLVINETLDDIVDLLMGSISRVSELQTKD